MLIYIHKYMRGAGSSPVARAAPQPARSDRLRAQFGPLQAILDPCRPLRTHAEHSETNAVSELVCTGPHWSARVSIHIRNPVPLVCAGRHWSFAVSALVCTGQHSHPARCSLQTLHATPRMQFGRSHRFRAPPLHPAPSFLLGCLAHKKPHHPWDPPRTLGIG